MMQNHIEGFTLIELMIVVAIIGILSAIAIPAYQDFVTTSADDACLSEASGYAQQSFANIQLERTVTDPVKNACKTLDTASAMTASTLGTITATPKTPGKATITCDLSKGASCTKS